MYSHLSYFHEVILVLFPMAYLIHKLALCSISTHAPRAVATLELGVCDLGTVGVIVVARVAVIDAWIYRCEFGG